MRRVKQVVKRSVIKSTRYQISLKHRKLGGGCWGGWQGRQSGSLLAAGKVLFRIAISRGLGDQKLKSSTCITI